MWIFDLEVGKKNVSTFYCPIFMKFCMNLFIKKIVKNFCENEYVYKYGYLFFPAPLQLKNLNLLFDCSRTTGSSYTNLVTRGSEGLAKVNIFDTETWCPSVQD